MINDYCNIKLICVLYTSDGAIIEFNNDYFLIYICIAFQNLTLNVIA